MASPKEQEYINNLSQYSRNILAALIRLGLSKDWLCDEVGLKKSMLNYKLRNPDKFADHERKVIEDLFEAERLER